MTSTILIIDDDNMLRDTLAELLRESSYTVLTADSAENGQKIFDKFDCDLIVLDRMMPGIDGLTLLKKWRDSGITTPIILLTALGDTENVIAGLQTGANDYLGKPFHSTELVLRINNALRTQPAKPAETLGKYGIKKQNNNYYINSKIWNLNETEQKIFDLLIKPIGGTISNDEIVKKTGMAATSIPMAIKRLRIKIKCAIPSLSLQTVYKQGYKIIPTKG